MPEAIKARRLLFVLKVRLVCQEETSLWLWPRATIRSGGGGHQFTRVRFLRCLSFVAPLKLVPSSRSENAVNY